VRSGPADGSGRATVGLGMAARRHAGGILASERGEELGPLCLAASGLQSGQQPGRSVCPGKAKYSLFLFK